MMGKLKDYQVIDIFCGGTLYKVKHKVTNNLFAWKAFNCSAYTTEQIQNIVKEVKIISESSSDNLLRYYDTILHTPTKTLYFVLEYHSWRSIQELLGECKETGKHFAENFIWYLLHELARVCKHFEDLSLAILTKCIKLTSVFVNDAGEIRVDCFDLGPASESTNLMRQVGDVIRTVCYQPSVSDDKIKECHYTDDLIDIIRLLTNEDKSSVLRPDVILYHPTVLTNIEMLVKPKYLTQILVSKDSVSQTSNVNRCDSEKAVELARAVEPLPRTKFNIPDSPIYCNISSKRKSYKETSDGNSTHDCLSPTLAALALELPGYVPRSRRPYSEAVEPYNRPQLVSEQTLSQEWMSRLMALRQREDSLNKRERDIISKEIVSSPTTKVISLNESQEGIDNDSNGITLPLMLSQASEVRRESSSRRRRRRSGVRRKSYAYEDLDSSLSADAGDTSLVITATKFTADNMPRRNIFPEVSTKKVHFTPKNPFVESDESVTLTFYDLENIDREGYQMPKTVSSQKDISKFKYLDLEKSTSEKRSAVNWSHSSPSKQAKMTKTVFNDISNTSSIRKTPSKTSLTSKGSSSSRFSMLTRSQWSVESCDSRMSEGVFERTRSSIRHSVAHTPIAPDMKKKSRKSLIPFKTPFKFMSKS